MTCTHHVGNWKAVSASQHLGSLPTSSPVSAFPLLRCALPRGGMIPFLPHGCRGCSSLAHLRGGRRVPRHSGRWAGPPGGRTHLPRGSVAGFSTSPPGPCVWSPAARWGQWWVSRRPCVLEFQLGCLHHRGRRGKTADAFIKVPLRRLVSVVVAAIETPGPGAPGAPPMGLMGQGWGWCWGWKRQQRGRQASRRPPEEVGTAADGPGPGPARLPTCRLPARRGGRWVWGEQRDMGIAQCRG